MWLSWLSHWGWLLGNMWSSLYLRVMVACYEFSTGSCTTPETCMARFRLKVSLEQVVLGTTCHGIIDHGQVPLFTAVVHILFICSVWFNPESVLIHPEILNIFEIISRQSCVNFIFQFLATIACADDLATWGARMSQVYWWPNSGLCY